MYSKKTNGVIWFLISRLSLVILVILARYLANTINAIQVASLQNLSALIFFIPIFLTKGIGSVSHSKNLHLHFLRGTMAIIGTIIWYYAFTKIPLPEAFAINYSLPLFITIFAIIFLKEKLTQNVFISLLLGFFGMLLILRPHFSNGMTVVHWYIILATCFLAIANILNKVLVNRKETPYSIVFYMSFTAGVLTLPYIIKNFKPLNYNQIILFLFLGLFSNISYLTTSIAFGKRKNIAYLQPLDFLRLVLITIASYFLFNETISFTSILGVMIILLSEQILLSIKQEK